MGESFEMVCICNLVIYFDLLSPNFFNNKQIFETVLRGNIGEIILLTWCHLLGRTY